MKQGKRLSPAVIMFSALMLECMAAAYNARAAEEPPVPDFTRGGRPDESHDWTLGPTGARGWMYGRNGQTADARQILVTAVAAGSPADGSLRADDVILGVDGRPFAADARKGFAQAVTAAEAGSGALRLVRWRAGPSTALPPPLESSGAAGRAGPSTALRAGQTTNVELKLPVLGAYSATAPYDCPKSKKIFEQGCAFIARQGLPRADIPMDLNALALLASGNKAYHPRLADYARKAAASLHPGVWTWYYGHGVLFLAEYVLATGDQSLLGELRRTAREATLGQSAVGTWGHEFYVRPSGNLNGYGCMNLPGSMVTLALVVAREAGVKDPDVDRAIAKSAKFLRYYVDKGAIPYGDHAPWPGHEDNGKCSVAAVLFDLLGDGEAAGYFARMGLAGYDERERGHTGNFYNMLWALPGVARCGPRAAGAYVRETSWYYDLARGWQGNFEYQGSPIGEEEHHKYTGWDCTGAYLLSYALPLRSLYLTGKRPCAVAPLDRRAVAEVIAAGRDYFAASGKNGVTYAGRATAQLLAGLSSWSPAVRKRSAQTLGEREGDIVPALLKQLAGPDRYGRYGACEALGCLGPRADAAAPQLRALLRDPDPWLECLACNALVRLGPEARQASVNDLLALAARQNPDDPRGMVNRAVAAALFDPNPDLRRPGILQHALAGVDRPLLYPAMARLLQNDDALARYGLTPYLSQLDDRDLAALLPAMVRAVEQLAPSDEMFGDGIRLAGLDLLTRRHIREGMALCVSLLEPDRWGEGRRIPQCLKFLLRYGTHAREVLPQLRDVSRGLAPGLARQFREPLDKAMADIEACTETPTLVALKDLVAPASARGAAAQVPRQPKP